MSICARLVALSGWLALSAVALPATITITDPVPNDFLGRSNNVSFNIANATVRVEVIVTATFNDDTAISVTQRREFTPNAQGNASGSIPLNFPESQPNGEYTIEVDIVSTDPYNNVADIPVTVDVQNPKILNFNPIQNTFVRDVVQIFAQFSEENIKEWRVTVGGNDIPGNVGATNIMNVNWDASAILSDGQQNISIRIEDLAGNSASQSIPVTIDRLPPSSNVLAPLASQTYRPGARIPVVVEISDQFAESLDERTVDVIITDKNGEFLARAARISTTRQGNNLVWTGRLRDTNTLPNEFVIKVQARDKAGNQATDQTVTIVTTRAGGFDVLAEDEEGQGSGAVRDAARLAKIRGGMTEHTRRLFTRTPRQIFGRGYNSGSGN